MQIDHDLIREAAIYGYDSGDVATGEFTWDDVRSREAAQDKYTNEELTSFNKKKQKKKKSFRTLSSLNNKPLDINDLEF